MKPDLSTSDTPRDSALGLGRGLYPSIPDHELLHSIGSGSYGEVWLARSVIGTYRAIKVINRRKFPVERPFDREFEGIKSFEPVSRSHPGLVNILHVGRNVSAGYFYYIMEIGDDIAGGQTIDPDRYVAKTLNTELSRRGRLPPLECIQIGLTLAAALNHLHRAGLVHRDIKPSNIIFVNGTPKFADIGLVTEISDESTFVGTEGYVPPEGPGKPTADLFSLGKLLYQLATGNDLSRFPKVPTAVRGDEANLLGELHQVILKACDLNPRKRFQTGDELTGHLSRLLGREPRSALGSSIPRPAAAPAASQFVVVLRQIGAQPDERLFTLIQAKLAEHNCRVHCDQHSQIGVEWAREVENAVTHSDLVVPLLSQESLQNEMIAYELEMAHEAAQQSGGKPKLFPVRIQSTAPLPNHWASVLEGKPYFLWNSPADDGPLLDRLIRQLLDTPTRTGEGERLQLEAVGGAVPLDSRFYVVRPADDEFHAAIARGDSIVLVKGARQMGKTSLLARGLDQARTDHSRVIFTDFQKLNVANFESLERFYKTLGDSVAEQLDLDTFPEDGWDARRSPNSNLERYLRREVLEKLDSALVWGMDEVDRLFSCSFSGEVFGLFRSWHNKRALDPQGPWAKMTLAIAYATEANLFITDLVQSPFNVGTRLVLDDFETDQVAELNHRYGSPLKTNEEIQRFIRQVGGIPYLVRRGLHELVTKKLDIAAFETQAPLDEGIFGDHLRRLLVSLAKDGELTEIVRGILSGRPCPNPETFYRLRSAGVVIGTSATDVRPRCQLYAAYLSHHLAGKEAGGR